MYRIALSLEEHDAEIPLILVNFKTNYYDRSSFASKTRLLQSIWRTEKGYELEEEKVYGNFLNLDFAKESGANFLTKEIFELMDLKGELV